MEILKKDVELNEVLSCYERENQGSASFEYAKGLLAHADRDAGGGWTLVLFSRAEILDIMLPDHRHPRENQNVLIPKPGMTVSTAAARVKDITQEKGLCWENIHSHKDRDFSQVHIFLQYQNGVFMNLDGLHRLLAWAVFEKREEIGAYVAGFPNDRNKK